LYYNSIVFYGPHPKALEKSFPVPKGIIAIGASIGSMPNLTYYPTTHMTVPSPPQTTVIVFFF